MNFDAAGSYRQHRTAKEVDINKAYQLMQFMLGLGVPKNYLFVNK